MQGGHKKCYLGVAYACIINCTAARLQPHIDDIYYKLATYSDQLLKWNFGTFVISIPLYPFWVRRCLSSSDCLYQVNEFSQVGAVYLFTYGGHIHNHLCRMSSDSVLQNVLKSIHLWLSYSKINPVKILCHSLEQVKMIELTAQIAISYRF